MKTPGAAPGSAEGPDFTIETMIDGTDQILAVKPPVYVGFREVMFDVLAEKGLIREAASRENFFATQHLPDGSQYSMLRLSGDALKHAGTTIRELAQTSAGTLRDHQRTVEVSPYLLSAGGSQGLFERGKRDS